MRLHLRLSDSAERMISGLTDRLNVPPKEVIIDSLALYQHAAKAIAEGKRLGVMSENGEFQQVITPTLGQLAEDSANETIASS